MEARYRSATALESMASPRPGSIVDDTGPSLSSRPSSKMHASAERCHGPECGCSGGAPGRQLRLPRREVHGTQDRRELRARAHRGHGPGRRSASRSSQRARDRNRCSTAGAPCPARRARSRACRARSLPAMRRARARSRRAGRRFWCAPARPPRCGPADGTLRPGRWPATDPSPASPGRPCAAVTPLHDAGRPWTSAGDAGGCRIVSPTTFRALPDNRRGRRTPGWICPGSQAKQPAHARVTFSA